MSNYKRKTMDVWEIQQYFHPNGWECVTEEETAEDARQMLKDYRDNQPQYPARIVKKRVKNGGVEK